MYINKILYANIEWSVHRGTLMHDIPTYIAIVSFMPVITIYTSRDLYINIHNRTILLSNSLFRSIIIYFRVFRHFCVTGGTAECGI